MQKLFTCGRNIKELQRSPLQLPVLQLLTISLLVWSLSPKIESSQVKQLVNEVNGLKNKDRELDNKIKDVDNKSEKKLFFNPSYRYNGTGFMIDSQRISWLPMLTLLEMQKLLLYKIRKVRTLMQELFLLILQKTL